MAMHKTNLLTYSAQAEHMTQSEMQPCKMQDQGANAKSGFKITMRSIKG